MRKRTSSKAKVRKFNRKQLLREIKFEVECTITQMCQYQRIYVKVKTKSIGKNNKKGHQNIKQLKSKKEIQQQVVRMILNVLGYVRYKDLIPKTSTVRVLVWIRLEEELITLFQIWKAKKTKDYADEFIIGLINILEGQRRILFSQKIREWILKQNLKNIERKLLCRQAIRKVLQVKHRSRIALSFFQLVKVIFQRSQANIDEDIDKLKVLYALFEKTFMNCFLDDKQSNQLYFQDILQNYKKILLGSLPNNAEFSQLISCFEESIKNIAKDELNRKVSRKQTRTDLKPTMDQQLQPIRPQKQVVNGSDDSMEQFVTFQLGKKKSYEHLLESCSLQFIEPGYLLSQQQVSHEDKLGDRNGYSH